MQWDDSEKAGFTDGEPWIKINPNCKEINAASQLDDPDSIFHYYQKLIITFFLVFHKKGQEILPLSVCFCCCLQNLKFLQNLKVPGA